MGYIAPHDRPQNFSKSIYFSEKREVLDFERISSADLKVKNRGTRTQRVVQLSGADRPLVFLLGKLSCLAGVFGAAMPLGNVFLD